MKSPSETLSHLREMINLEERRHALQRELDDLMHKLGRMTDALASEAGSAIKAVKDHLPSLGGAGAAKQPRGSLRDKILAELRNAGANGISVQELAAKIGTKSGSIYSWLQSTGKRVPGIKKVGPARYTLSGSAAARVPAATANRTAAKPATNRTSANTGKRGALSESIIALLKAAGAKGISIKELSEKTGTNYKNISIWFSTTGKKNYSIKRVSPGVYRLG